MLTKYAFIICLLYSFFSYSQNLPINRTVDWTAAGLQDTTTSGFTTIELSDYAFYGDSIIPNDSIMQYVLDSIVIDKAILIFPAGNFLFKEILFLKENIILRGQGATETVLFFNQVSQDHSIIIQGKTSNYDTTFVTNSLIKNTNYIKVNAANNLVAGDWIKVLFEDSDLVTSTWATNTVGQIIQIKEVFTDSLTLKSAIRLDIDTAKKPFILKLEPIKNVGIECLKIHRMSSTIPYQKSNIYISNAVNCWVNGIESENCTFAHIDIRLSSNIQVSKSYFHHGFDYGGGGRAYGVMIHITANECLVEDNIFNNLRHSMIVQAGANCNVFAYNYSINPNRTEIPFNFAGDMVLHGNYPFANLFEQNICQNLSIDNSHGANGIHNTYLRNRAELYGIFMSANNSPSQNFIGNEITNLTNPYAGFNYNIVGADHFIFANNNKGTVVPDATDIVIDKSYYYDNKPSFLAENEWAKIGELALYDNVSIPAKNRFISEYQDNTYCKVIVTPTDTVEPIDTISTIYAPKVERFSIYPNHFESYLNIESSEKFKNIQIFDAVGKLVFEFKNPNTSIQVNTLDWQKGLYLISIQTENKTRIKKALKY
jgi:hypothetical protein